MVLDELQSSLVSWLEVCYREWQAAFFIFFLLSRCELHRVSTGMTGPLGFGLSLRDSSLVFIFFGLATGLAASFLSVFGAKLGMRQMIQARFSFGYVFASTASEPKVQAKQLTKATLEVNTDWRSR
jgi:cytosine/uracil/thiamine/allantoin permease